eukprot:109127_1
MSLYMFNKNSNFAYITNRMIQTGSPTASFSQLTTIDDDEDPDDEKVKEDCMQEEEMAQESKVTTKTDYLSRINSTCLNFLPLGLFAFGGPSAYAILHERFVEAREWLNEEQFLEYLALCQALPGPSATQLVVAIAFRFSGYCGALIALCLWCLPTFIIAMLVGLGLHELNMEKEPDWMSGFAPAAISLVFIAAYKLGNKCIFHNKKITFVKSDKEKYFNILILISILSAIAILFVTSIKEEVISNQSKGFVYPLVIFGGGLITLCDSKIPKRHHLYANFKANVNTNTKGENTKQWGKYVNCVLLIVIWLSVLFTLLLLRYETDTINNSIWLLCESLWRTGSIVYGGGQVILPMLFGEVVDTEWISEDQFWTGYALAQILPGPLSGKIAAYIGALMHGVLGSILAWIALCAPGMLLMFAFLPILETFKKWIWFQIMMEGINCAAIGLLVSACIKLWSSAVQTVSDSCVVLITASLVAFWKIPTPIAIICGGVLGFLFSETVFGIGQKVL